MKSRECFEVEISNKVTGGERLPWQEMRNTGKRQSIADGLAGVKHRRSYQP